MTTLLQEFDEWLRKYLDDNKDFASDHWYEALHFGLEKLEELKKKHKIG